MDEGHFCILQVNILFNFSFALRFSFLHLLIFYYIADGLNGVEYSQVDQVKAHFIAYEILMESQKDQIMGVVHIGDFRGATTDHVSLWHNPIELMKLLKWGEQSIPLRHKEIRFYNVPFILKYIIDAGKGIVTSKIRDRIHVSCDIIN